MFLRRLSLKLLVLLLVSAPHVRAYTPLQLALDDVGLDLTSDSSPQGSPWVTHTTVVDCVDETDGAKSPAMSQAGDSWIETTVTGPDTIDFVWSLVTTAPNTLTCTLDGAVKASCPPSVAGRWTHASVVVPAGPHLVRWNYKQTGTAGGKALLDMVSLAGDNWPSLMESPYLQVLAGEPVSHRFATKQPALLWEVYWDTLPPGLTLDPQTGIISGIAEQPGIWRPLIRVTSASIGLYYRVMFEVLDQPTLLSALDSRSLTFTTSASDGTSVWTPQPHGSRDDGDCIVAGLPPPVKRTVPFTPGWSLVSTTVNGPDVLSYWVRVANGQLILFLDDREFRAHGPSQALPSWRRVWLTIPAGQHTITWKYETYLNQGPTAWLDDIHLGSEGGVFIRHQPEIGPLFSNDFSYPVPFSGTVGNWSAPGMPNGLTLNPGSGVVSGTPLVHGVWQVRVTLQGTNGDHDDVFARIDTSIPPADAVDLPNSWWNTGPEPGACWYGQDAVSHDGRDALRSPPVPSGETSSLTTTLAGPGTLRWWWHIPAGSAGDSCSFVIDGGKPLVTLNAPSPWAEASVTIPEGLHELSWRWTTDTAGDPDTEAVFVDQVSLTP